MAAQEQEIFGVSHSSLERGNVYVAQGETLKLRQHQRYLRRLCPEDEAALLV